MDVDENRIVQPDLYESDREPDDEDFEGYTGNEGASATHWYRDAVSKHLQQNNMSMILIRAGLCTNPKRSLHETTHSSN